VGTCGAHRGHLRSPVPWAHAVPTVTEIAPLRGPAGATVRMVGSRPEVALAHSVVQPPCPVGTVRMAPWGGPAGPGAAPAYRGPTTFWWVPLSPWPASAATRFLASGAHKIHSAADFSGVFKTKTTSMPLACISCTHRCSIRARYCSASSDGANQRNTLCEWISSRSLRGCGLHDSLPCPGRRCAKDAMAKTGFRRPLQATARKGHRCVPIVYCFF